MDTTHWSPFSHSYPGHLSSSAPHEDSLSNYGGGNPNSLLLSSCQGLQPLSSRTNADPSAPPSGLPNSNFEALISPSIQPSKETDFFGETVFNGVCKENQAGIRNFVQVQGSASRNEAAGFPSSESTAGYSGQVPTISFHSSNIDRPSPGPFGVLPHEAVMTRSGRYERNSEKFISKTASASYNNGPYTDRDVGSIYSSAPLSAQSAFSGDTASLSPAVNSVTSPTISNFSSPSGEYYSSPKPNFGAYNSLQSPVPQSPSVAQQSYPPSPFGTVDSVSHIGSAPPCSPMSGGAYVNNLNAVPQRNGQKMQHSPSNSAASNNVMCYNAVQSQSMVHHGQQSVLSKPSDYHSEYSVFAHDHNSPSSYSSVYPAIHPGQMPSGSNSRISPRTHSQHPNSMSHDGRVSYGHSAPVPSSSLSSPSYLQNKVSHETSFGTCSSSIPPGQSMHPPRYPSCSPSMNTLRSNSLSASMISHPLNERQYGFSSSEVVDDKNALDMFNSHVDSGVHNHDNSSSLTNFLNDDLPILDTDMLTNRQLRSSELNESQNCSVNVESSSRSLTVHPSTSKEPQKDEILPGNFPYSSSRLDQNRPGNFTFASPRRRGRRGRRRKVDVNSSNISTRFQSFKSDRNIFNNGYAVSSSKVMLEYENVECYKTYPKRLCDQKELPTVNYPLSRYRLEMKTLNENQKKQCSVVLSKPRKVYRTVEEEVAFLNDMVFPDEEEKSAPTFMKTRNKDSEGFLNCYVNFLANRKPGPDSDPESPPEHKPKHDFISKEHKTHRHGKKKPIPKIVLKSTYSKNGKDDWQAQLRESGSPEISIGSEESASESSEDVFSSHKIKQEYDSKEKSKQYKSTGKLSKVSEKFLISSAKQKNDSVDHNGNYNYLKDNHLHFTNSETLPAGKLKIKTEIDSSQPCENQLPSMPKKRGRKAKKPPVIKTESKKKKSSIKSPELTNSLPITIKQEIIEDGEILYESSRRSTLRSRKGDILKEAEPGPSIKKEPIEISSDDIDIIDDSDSDPAWTPSVKIPKVTDNLKIHSVQPTTKRRIAKKSRKNSVGSVKQKRDKSQSTRKKPPSEKSVPTKVCKKEKLCEPVKVKKEKIRERFLIAKADINRDMPFIWRVDKETNMLQRFECYEHQGVLLYRSTYTYAAWNEVSFSNYVTANVKTVSRSRVLFIVEYLGPVLSETAEDFSAEITAIANPLRENFEVFLQTLISQALDQNFLSEITTENDEYFLSNIKEIEKITEAKKNTLLKDSWDDELRKCANTYPCVNMLDSISDDINCQVCNIQKGIKLLQFYGQPYDWTTLGSVEMPLATKTQFNLCDVCCAIVSLYNRLHHQKYNFFIKCRTKMNEVKGDSEKIESHVLLEDCLQDHTWVNALFEELEQMWKECDEKS